MPLNENTYSIRRDSLLATHSVLRNTYLLLSLTLLFSAGAAWFGVVTQASFGGAMIAILASFALIFITGALRNSVWGILAVFAFTGCTGYSMGPLLNHFIKGYSNGGTLILTALGGTGVTFFLCSAYVLVTKKDMSHMGKFLMIGLVVALLASLGNIFFKMPALQLAISSVMILISAMYMMYETSRIINNGETNYIMATISLFIFISAMFQNLLMLLGFTNGRE